jgi:hypothetical protein
LDHVDIGADDDCKLALLARFSRPVVESCSGKLSGWGLYNYVDYNCYGQVGLMSSFDLSREREALARRYMAGELAPGEYGERLDEIYNEYREALQRARQEDAPDPVDDERDDEEED